MSVQTENRVKDVMSTPLETISRRATVSEAAAQMREKGINALVVTTDPPSIITSTDILEAVAEDQDVSTLSVRDLMTESVETVPPNIRAAEAAAMMETFGIHHLPVEDGGDYVGMVSATDVATTIS